MVSRSIETAQRKVEARNFDIRKQLLEYDDVSNDQRREIYRLRNDVLEAGSVADMVANLRAAIHRSVPQLCAGRVGRGAVGHRRPGQGACRRLADRPAAAAVAGHRGEADRRGSARTGPEGGRRSLRAKVGQVGAEAFGNFERSIMLQLVDQHWREHLAALDHLRQASTCAATRRSSPNRNTSARRSSCSARLSTGSAPT